MDQKPGAGHTQAAAGKLAEELRGNFVLQHEDQIVRSANAVAAVLTAQLWEDKTKGLNLYFVATNQEITLVVFDPKAFGKGDFFNGLELLKKVEANNESIRRTLGKSAAPSLQIIDLLATQKTDNVTPPPADAPPAVSAPSSPTTESADAVVALPDTHPPMQAGKQKAPLWPWIAGGILVLILIVALALKRRAQ